MAYNSNNSLSKICDKEEVNLSVLANGDKASESKKCKVVDSSEKSESNDDGDKDIEMSVYKEVRSGSNEGCASLGDDASENSNSHKEQEATLDEAMTKKLNNSTAKPKKLVLVSEECWSVADALVSSIVVAPLVVGSWRGLWCFMNVYPNFFPDLLTAFFGITLHTSFAILRKQLLERAAGGWWSRMYTWWFLVACVCQWRGSWEAWSRAVDVHRLAAPWSAACLAALLLLKAVRNLITAPYFVQMDLPANTYHFHTRFRQSSREPLLYVLDCLFSVVVVGSLVVFVWRGVWDLLDIYLYPQNAAWSAWASFIIGYGLALITFLLQGPARRACTKLKGGQRLIVADLFLLLSFIATINVWRSVWSLLDIYFLPENPALSNIITHGGCFLLLMLLNCANSVLVRGVYIDAEEEGGQCVVFPCYYLRLFFQKERVKKRQKRLESISVERGDGEGPGIQPLISKTGAAPVIVKTTTTSANHIVVHLPVENNEIPPSDDKPHKDT